MAAINTAINEARRAGVRRQNKKLPRIDMTPMVDLGFLLICFFVITTELGKPVVVKLNMPADGPAMPLGNSNALTVLVSGDNKAWLYEGNWKDARAANAITATSIGSARGLRKTIIDKKKGLGVSGSKEGADGLMVLVKADENANYYSLIDLLDEMLINDVKKYAIVKMEAEEAAWIKDQP